MEQQPQIEGVVTKRAAWPDARGRIFLEVDGRVIILADECAAKAGDRITYKGLARAALEDGTQYYRARRTRSTLTVVDRTSAPCQLRGQVAGVSPTRSCFWLQGGQHVLAGRFALPLMGQVIELYGGEVTNAGNYAAGATASMRADGQGSPHINMDSCEAGPSRPTTARWRLLQGASSATWVPIWRGASGRREVSSEAGAVGARRAARGLLPSRKDDEEEPLKASLLEDARPGRVDAVVSDRRASRRRRRVRGRSASVLLKAHAEATTCLSMRLWPSTGAASEATARSISSDLVAARHRIICEGDGVRLRSKRWKRGLCVGLRRGPRRAARHLR